MTVALAKEIGAGIPVPGIVKKLPADSRNSDPQAGHRGRDSDSRARAIMIVTFPGGPRAVRPGNLKKPAHKPEATVAVAPHNTGKRDEFRVGAHSQSRVGATPGPDARVVL